MHIYGRKLYTLSLCMTMFIPQRSFPSARLGAPTPVFGSHQPSPFSVCFFPFPHSQQNKSHLTIILNLSPWRLKNIFPGIRCMKDVSFRRLLRTAEFHVPDIFKRWRTDQCLLNGGGGGCDYKAKQEGAFGAMELFCILIVVVIT